MKKTLYYLHAALLLALICAPRSLAATRTWTNNEGQTMEAEIIGLEGDAITFKRDDRTYKYPIENLSETDQKLARGWAVENAEKTRQLEAQKKVAKELAGKLVRVQGSSLRRYAEEDLKSKRLFALYYSASWCGPCKSFTPDLVKLYNDVSRKHPDFEVILVSSDRSSRDMTNYMKDFRMDWAAVSYNDRGSIPLIRENGGRSIPRLVFLDGTGEVISSTAEKNRSEVLQDIRAHLASNDL